LIAPHARSCIFRDENSDAILVAPGPMAR
jgi:hypothetical protein